MKMPGSDLGKPLCEAAVVPPGSSSSQNNLFPNGALASSPDRSQSLNAEELPISTNQNPKSGLQQRLMSAAALLHHARMYKAYTQSWWWRRDEHRRLWITQINQSIRATTSPPPPPFERRRLDVDDFVMDDGFSIHQSCTWITARWDGTLAELNCQLRASSETSPRQRKENAYVVYVNHP